VLLLKHGTARDADLSAGLAAIVAAAAYLLFASAVIAANGRYRWPLEDLAVPLAAFLIAARTAVIPSRSLETGGSFP